MQFHNKCGMIGMAPKFALQEVFILKLLSIAIPCYNSAAYMDNCIKSLLPGGDEVEILIVNDGSTKDNTAEIADRYEKEYPGICRAIHQENGGHGEAVNAGLRNATGVFFKVVDSDDWVNEEAYMKVLETLRKFVYGKDTLDMLITNFVYEKQGAKHKKVMNYNRALPKNEVFTWALYSDAFCHLSYRTFKRVQSGTSETYILCRQYFRLRATSACTENVLSGCELLPLLYRPFRSVCQ